MIMKTKNITPLTINNACIACANMTGQQHQPKGCPMPTYTDEKIADIKVFGNKIACHSKPAISDLIRDITELVTHIDVNYDHALSHVAKNASKGQQVFIARNNGRKVEAFKCQMKDMEKLVKKWNCSDSQHRIAMFGLCAFSNKLVSPFTYLEPFMGKLMHNGAPLEFVRVDLGNSFPKLLCRIYEEAKYRQSDIMDFPDFEETCGHIETLGFSGSDTVVSNELKMLYDHYSWPVDSTFQTMMPSDILSSPCISDNHGDPDESMNAIMSNHIEMAKLLHQNVSGVFRHIWLSLMENNIKFIPINEAIYVLKTNFHYAKELFQDSGLQLSKQIGIDLQFNAHC